jgi:predicted nucleic acid-binding protein
MSEVPAVLYTNVMVAALRSDARASRRLLIAALTGNFELLPSVTLMIEYEAVLKRPEHLEAAGAAAADIDAILDALLEELRGVAKAGD